MNASRVDARGPVDDELTADVFISHGSEDAAIARRIKGHLEGGGYRCWMAPDDVKGPETWAEQIVGAIQGCRVMLVLVSDRANRSPHVSKEVDLAMDAGKPLLPVRVEDVAPEGALRYLLALAQWVDAFPGPVDDYAAAVRSRIAAILGDETRRITAEGAGGVAAKDGRKRPSATRAGRLRPSTHDATRRWPRWVPWAAAGAAMVVVAGIAVGMNVGRGSPDATTITVPSAPEDEIPPALVAVFDQLYDECGAGRLESCGELALRAPPDSFYTEHGYTCGGVGCRLLIGDAAAPGDHAYLDDLLSTCTGGSSRHCELLSIWSPPGSDYERLAETCREAAASGTPCEIGQ